ncbi:right-handed parallel beta-helix repeat-containing protein [Sphingobacterium sp. SYP-B4668]|uniref:right-handed parallel beta-helix repeat-containing protein n=1 Tax=Sphingobacterium sp. SYP-B4668 TaxID=2996035 RepID=UPI0022DE1C08|nr:right-handed parallel beta-helix repeat-containing protein [Sphingobacterium sp. SYP-B4668]
MKQLQSLIFLLIPYFLSASTYYIDPTGGKDTNSGLSSQEAWKSFNRLADLRLSAGDHVVLKRGEIFKQLLELSGQGSFMEPIVVSTYGQGPKPVIMAPDHSLYAVRIRNSSYLQLKDIEVVNTGSTVLPSRTGVKLESKNYGTAHAIVLSGLDIRDVNGSLVKSEGGGSGILIESRGDSILSNFDALVIEDCTIKRCQRNGMIWSANWNRNDRWFPSTNTIIRNNFIEGVPGDGIVPIACVNTLIEFNKMIDCPETLPQTEAAAGFWPWSCDNTTIQFNEVTGHNAPWDAQGFDSDYNCRNTVIQYNYSHQNAGGFVLICNSGESQDQIGNIGTRVQYNLSIDDGNRTRPTRVGMFSPSIHIAGPAKETSIYRNIIYAGPKSADNVHRSILTSDSWGGYADQTKIFENLFIAQQKSSFDLQASTNNLTMDNTFIGQFDSHVSLEKTNKMNPERHTYSAEVLRSKFLKIKRIAQGMQDIVYIDRQAIEDFFAQIPSPNAE